MTSNAHNGETNVIRRPVDGNSLVLNMHWPSFISGFVTAFIVSVVVALVIAPLMSKRK